MNLLDLVRRRSGYFWMGVVVVGSVALIIILGSILSWVFWDHLHGSEGAVATTIRNVALVISAPIALVLAVWRSIVASRQANTAQDQAQTAERGLLNERYQRSTEMLGSKVLSVRLGGIYALQRLAEEHPHDYLVQIVRLFSAFGRNPPRDSLFDGRFRGDVQAVLEWLVYRRAERIGLGYGEEGGLDLVGSMLCFTSLREGDLTGANLSGADLHKAIWVGVILSDADLSSVNLAGANLSGAILRGAAFWEAKLPNATLSRADLSGAFLAEANFSGAALFGADFSDADLTDANLSGAQFNHQVKGLTQSELDRAQADPGDPPQLRGCVDCQTGLALVWRTIT